VLRIFLQQTADDPEYWRGEPGIDRNERLRLGVADLRQDRQRSVAGERQLPRGHLVEHHADGEEVAPLVRLNAARLLRRDVVQRSEELAGGRVTRRGDVAIDQLRQAEVED